LWVYNWQFGGITFAQGLSKVAVTGQDAGLWSTLQATIENRIGQWNTFLLNWLKAPGGGNPFLSGMLALGIALNWRQFHIQTRRGFVQLSPLAFSLLLAGLYFLIGNAAPHYLFVLLPLLVPPALQGWQSWRRVPLALVVALMLLTNLYTVWNLTRTTVQRPNWAFMISQLESQRLTRGYSDYWHAYPITYLTGEKIIVSPRLMTFGGSRTERVQAYSAQVERAAAVFVLAPGNSPDSERVEHFSNTLTHNPSLQKIVTSDGTIYFSLGPEDALRQWLRSLKPNYYAPQ
jgi:hypothetical protein